MSEQGSREILETIAALPDLLAMAKAERGSQDFYNRQDSLRETNAQLNLPYKWTMPLRHLYTCASKEHTNPEVLFRLGRPIVRDGVTRILEIEIRASEIHEVVEHDIMLNDKQREFLNSVRPDPA